MRVVFFGTPDFAVPTLAALASSSHQVVGVVTQPDRPRGRGQSVAPSPVKVRAAQLGIPVLQPEKLRDDGFLAAFDALGAELGVVAAYGKLLPQLLLDRPGVGMINVHASLLPRWRGAAPIHRAVMAGDRETGVTIMRVVLALDAGPMLSRVATPIGPDETSTSVEARLAETGATLLVDTVERLARGAVAADAQDESLVTYAHRLERRESQVDWTLSAQDLHNRVRGLQPWPMAAGVLNGARLRFVASAVDPGDSSLASTPGTILSASPDGIDVATGSGVLRLTRVQPDGRAVMAVRDFLNSRRVASGDRFEPLPQP